MSDFDPEAFMNSTFSETNSTKYALLPQGEAIATIQDVKLVGGEKNDRPWLRLDVQWEITDPSYLELARKSSAKLRQGVLLDLTDNKQIDFGKDRNIKLGRLRTAIDLNTEGESFAFPMMVGRAAKLKITQKTIEGREDPINEVDGVAKIA